MVQAFHIEDFLLKLISRARFSDVEIDLFFHMFKVRYYLVT